MNSIGSRVRSNLKCLKVQQCQFFSEADSTIWAPAIGGLVLRTQLEELSLGYFVFPNAESFRSIAAAIKCCDTLTKVTFENCCFDPSASVLLKQVDVDSLTVVDMNGDFRFFDDADACYREILQPGSSITQLKLDYYAPELGSVVFQLLHGHPNLATLDICIFDDIVVNVLREHLPTLSGVQHLVLRGDTQFLPTPESIENLVGSLERNTSIGRVSVVPWDESFTSFLDEFSTAQLRRLQQVGAMNTYISNLTRVLELEAQVEQDCWYELVANANIWFDDSSTALYRCVRALASQVF